MFMQDITRFVASPALPHSIGAMAGLLPDTLVETAEGWRPAAGLTLGDRVHSWDGGLRRIAGLDRRPLPEGTEALLLPGGMLDACDDLRLLPGQHLLLDTAGDPSLPDALAVLVPAAALDGCPGIRRIRLPRTETVVPLFAEEEVIFANSGVMLHCPGITDGADSFFPRLSPVTARALLNRRLALAA